MWSMAAKNLTRDRRRTIVTATTVAVAALGLALFLGYVHFIEAALADVVIRYEGNGNVQIYRRHALDHIAAEPARYSLAGEEAKQLIAAANAIPGTVLATTQLQGVGMIQNGEKSTVFMATGVVPRDDAVLHGSSAPEDSDIAIPAGKSQVPPIAITQELGDVLGVKRDSNPVVQLSGITLANRFNALDAKVAGYFSTGIEETESKGIKLPIATLQSLYDTDAVSRVVVLLRDRAQSAAYARTLQHALDAKAPGVFSVTTWDNPVIGAVYDSFMGFFRSLFLFTGVIVAVISITAVQHTVAMNLTERTREIGMLRSVGFSRAAISWLFAQESLMTAAAGSAAGLLAAYIIVAAVGALHLTTTLPRVSAEVVLQLRIPLVEAAAILLLAPVLVAAFSMYTAWRGGGGRILAYLQSAHALWVVVVLSFAFAVPLAHADDRAARPTKADIHAWLVAADQARGGYGSYAWRLQIHSVDAQGTTDTSYRIDVKNGKALAYTTAPPKEKGETILVDGRAMWFMKSGLRRPVSVSPRQRLVGQAANGDIASVQYARDYEPSLLGRARIDGRECYKLKLTAKNNAVTYDQIIYYVDIKTHLGVRADFLTVSGRPFKYAMFDYRNRVKGKTGETPFVSTMKIVNSAFPNEFSVLSYRDVHAQVQPDSKFNLDNFSTF